MAKKGDQSIAEIMYTMMSLLFLLLGTVLLFSILMATINPYDQMAFANVEKLRATMDQVCFTGQDATISFSLPQNTPYFTSVVSVMPLWIIRTNGDPNYVVYYESFPAGDATGWEIYHNMQNRVLAPYKGNDGDNADAVFEYAKKVRDEWSQVISRDDVELKSDGIEGVIINNIMLGGQRSDYFGGDKEIADGGSSFGSGAGGGAGTTRDYGGQPLTHTHGQWKELQNPGSENPVPAEGDNTFIFNNYRTLTSFEKASIKYAPCGDNSLCLKTRTGVYRFPLRHCNIKYVEIVYDARNNAVRIFADIGVVVAAAAGTKVLVLTAAGWIPTVIGGSVSGTTSLAPGAVAAMAETAGGSLAAETGIAIVSRAGTIIGFIKKTGSAASWLGKGLWKFIGSIPILGKYFQAGTVVVGGAAATYTGYEIGEYLAGAFFSYKIQDFNIASSCSIEEMTIKNVKCSELDCIKMTSYPIYQYQGNGNLKAVSDHYTCLEKIGSDIDTVDAAKLSSNDDCLQIFVEERPKGFCWTPDPYKGGQWYFTTDADTELYARLLGFLPINENTAYISSSSINAVVLKYYPLGQLEDWKEFFERRLSWGWPATALDID